MSQRRRISKTRGLAKAACTGLVAFSVLLPSGLAGAQTSAATDTAAPATLNDSSSKVKADPAKAKITKEQAVAKVKELFPALKDAVAQNVKLGVDNMYPAPSNQMVWNIEWEYQTGNTTYGFSSLVDAINGDLINTYLHMSNDEDGSYYPPKLTREQAQEVAKAFIAKAAPSITLAQLEERDTSGWYADGSALFGPVQYSFYFQPLHNGIPSPEYVSVTVDGNGNTISFSKSYEIMDYPDGTAVVTQAAAEQAFKDGLEIELRYIPVDRSGKVKEWILAWQTKDETAYPIDAVTGKRLNYEGKVLADSRITYVDVPASKNVFKPRTSGEEITADEAAEIVKKTVMIPEGRTQFHSSFIKDYADPDRKTWQLTWEEESDMSRVGSGGIIFPSRTSATIDALSGQILEYRLEEFNGNEEQAGVTPPKGAVKLTDAAARQRAFELVNLLVPNAAQDYKLDERVGETHKNEDENGYEYQFTRMLNGLPVNNLGISLGLDVYGNLEYFSVGRAAGIDKLQLSPSAAKVTKEEALKAYQDFYKLKLQYSSYGGHYNMNNSYVDSVIKLVYSPEAKDPMTSGQVLDAVSGEWKSVYRYEILDSVTSVPADVKGHAAEKELTALLQHGVITPDEQGSVKPDEQITLGDWLGMIAGAVTPYYESYSSYYGVNEQQAIAGVKPDSPYYSAVNYAAERQWINRSTELKVDAKLTREQFAVSLASILKYNKLAQFLTNDESLNQFGDKESITRKGEVALNIKLGLLQGQNGKFNPQGAVTKADAAVVLMQLVKLQGKTDQAIGQY